MLVLQMCTFCVAYPRTSAKNYSKDVALYFSVPCFMYKEWVSFARSRHVHA